MWRSPHEIGNDEQSGKHQPDTRATCCKTAANKRRNETAIREDGQRECYDEDGAVVLTHQRDVLEGKCDNHQWNADSEQPTDALGSFHGV